MAWRHSLLAYVEKEYPNILFVEQQLTDNNWKVDVVLSYTTPLKYEPVEIFLSGVDQSRVDKSMEEWLDGIGDRLEYKFESSFQTTY